MSDMSPARDPLEQLAEEWRERLRRGESFEPDEYIARHPELADEIRDLFPAIVMMEELKPGAADISGAATIEGLAQGPPGLERLGDFRILREVGRGGMGVVYEAEQESLGRRVALKILPAQALADRHQQKRFQREARATARLHHTNIVPVYGVGEHDGMHYYVMQFIQGAGLDLVLAELKRLRKAKSAAGSPLTTPRPSATAPPPAGPPGRDVSAADVARSLMTGDFQPGQETLSTPSPGTPAGPSHLLRAAATEPARPGLSDSSLRLPGQTSALSIDSGKHYYLSVARIGIQVAEALDYANSQGIIHRDIKPSNLLLDNQGTVWVTDFGLAKALADGENLTHTGDIVGTLRYMAPERFSGQADARGDIYSLGLTLYELLVQQPAFGENDRNRLIHQVTHDEPVSPRRLNSEIPRDLETVLLKAIDREPARRYQTALALAEDLKRFVEDKPIGARRVRATERLWRWCRRNPALAGMAAGVLVLLAVIAIGSSVAALHFQHLAGREQAARQQTAAALQTAQSERASAEKARADAENSQKSEANQRRQAEQAQKLAEENFFEAKKAVEAFLARVSDKRLQSIPGLQPVRKELLESALTYYQGFVDRYGKDPALKTDLAEAYTRVARILDETGARAAALRAFDKTGQIRKQLVQDNPQDKKLGLELALHLQAVGNLHRRMGDKDAAVHSLQEAYDTLLAISPQDKRKATNLPIFGFTIMNVATHGDSDAEVLRAFAGILADKGQALQHDHPLSAAENYYQALYIYRKMLADAAIHEGDIVFRHKGTLSKSDPAEADKHYQVFTVRLESGQSYTIDLVSPDKSLDTLLRVHDSKRRFLTQDDDGGEGLNSRLLFRPGATDEYRLVVTSYEAHATGSFVLKVVRNPRNSVIALRQHELARQWSRTGTLLAALHMPALALRFQKEARAHLEDNQAGDSRQSADFDRDLAAVYESSGFLENALDRRQEALESYGRARKIRERLARENPALPDFQSELAETLLAIVDQGAEEASGGREPPDGPPRSPETLPMLHKAGELLHAAVAAAPDESAYLRLLARQQTVLARAYLKEGSKALALKSYEQARQIYEKLVPPSPAQARFVVALTGPLTDGVLRPLAALAQMRLELARMSSDDLLALAVARAGCGDAAAAGTALEQALAAGLGDIASGLARPEFEIFRARAEFQAMRRLAFQATAAVPWVLDFEEAKRRAAETNKDLLLYFGGKDWATSDSVIRRTILRRKSVVDYLSQHFVAVDLDKPSFGPPPPNLAKRNELTQKWRINTVVTLVLADAQGRPYATTTLGRSQLAPEAFMSGLKRLQTVRNERDRKFAEAAAAKNNGDRARGLELALRDLPAFARPEYGDIERQIFDLDRDNRLGLRAKYPEYIRDILVKRDFTQARELLDHMIQEEKLTAPAAREAYLQRGRAHIALGRFDLAARDLARGQAALSGNAEYALLHVYALIQLGDVQGYRKVCTDLLRKYQNTTNSWDAFLVAWTCGMAPDAVDDRSPVMALPRRFLTSNNEFLEWNALGLLQYRAGDFAEAEKSLRRSMAASPDWLARNELILALCNQRTGKGKEARKWLDKFFADFNRAELEHLHEKDYRDYLVYQQFMAEAAVLFPDSPLAKVRYLKAVRPRALMHLGQWDKAMADYDRAIAAQPDNLALYLERALCHERLKQSEKAAADRTRVLEVKSRDLAAARNRFDKSAKRRSDGDALEDVCRELAQIQEQLGQKLQATSTLSFVSQIAADDGGRHHGIARAIAALVPKSDSGPTGSDDQWRAAADTAIQSLNRALHADFLAPSRLKGDVAFQSLYARPDFQALWRETLERNKFGLAVGDLIRRFDGHSSFIEGCALSPDGKHALSAGLDKTVRLWDLATGKEVRRFRGHSGTVRGVAFSADTKLILAGDYLSRNSVGDFFNAAGDFMVGLWDVASGKLLRRFQGHKAPVTAVAFSPDNRRALSAGRDKTARLWDVASGKLLRTFAEHTGPLLAAAYCPDGKQAVTAGEDGTVLLWEIDSGKVIHRFEGHWGFIWTLAVSNDGTKLLSGGSDASVRLWDLHNRRLIRELVAAPIMPLPEQSVRSVVFTPDTRQAIIGRDGGSLEVYEVESGRPLHVFPHTDAGKLALAVSADGRSVLAAQSNSQLVLRSLDLEVIEARNLAHLGAWDAAEAAYARAIQKHPGDVQLRLEHARFLGRRGKWRAALDDFDRAIHEGIEGYKPWMERGRIHALLGQRDQAAADFARALDILPEESGWFSSSSEACLEIANWDAVFTRIVELRPKTGRLWIGRARHHSLRGRWAEAAADFARAIDTQPVHDEWLEYAAVQALAGDRHSYPKTCRRMIEAARGRRNGFFAFQLARLCCLLPDSAVQTSQLLAWGKNVGIAEPGAPWDLHVKAMVHYRTGQWQKAIELLEQSERADWGNGRAINGFLLAMAHHHLGHSQEARAWLESALRHFEEVRPAIPGEPAALPDVDWLESCILRREAEDLLNGKQPRTASR